MTIRYNSYIEALQNGTIDLNNVNLSVIVVSKYYKPKEIDLLENVTSRLMTFENLFTNNDMEVLSMSDIIERVTAYCKLYKSEKEISIEDIAGFVTYVNNTLCFYEDLKVQDNG